MKICIVNTHSNNRVGGSQVQCDLIARELTRLGHEVHYVAIDGPRGKNGSSYQVHPVAGSAVEIARKCIALAPDVIYWRFNKKCFYQSVRSIRGHGIPIVFSISHVADTQKWSSKTNVAWLNVRRVARLIKKKLSSRWNYRGFRFVSGVVTNNSDLLNILPVQRQIHIDNSLPLELSCESSVGPWPRPYCLWAASVKPQKQPERFIELAAGLEDSGVDFLMIGPIQSRDCLRIINSPNLPANFHYIGKRDNSTVNAFLRDSLLLVHTCLPEGFPNIFIQAWSLGKPVVSLCFDPEGILRSEGVGLFSGSFERLVDDVRNLINDSEMREQMGARAMCLVTRKFDLVQNVAKLERFLEETIDKNTSLGNRPNEKAHVSQDSTC